jgi:uncharacterized membrane protein
MRKQTNKKTEATDKYFIQFIDHVSIYGRREVNIKYMVSVMCLTPGIALLIAASSNILFTIIGIISSIVGTYLLSQARYIEDAINDLKRIKEKRFTEKPNE